MAEEMEKKMAAKMAVLTAGKRKREIVLVLLHLFEDKNAAALN